MRERLRVAQAGVAAIHADLYRDTLLLLRDEVELVGMFDPEPSAVQASIGTAAARVPLFDRLDDLLERTGPDVVFVSGVNREMPVWARQVAEAGVHLWVEKPVGATAAQVAELCGVVAASGIEATCGYTWRFHPVTRLVLDLRRQGILGDPWSIEFSHSTASVRVRGAERWQFDPDRSGGGILNWLGVHWFDLMRVIIAAEPIEVAALEARLGPDPVPVEDVATVGLRFSNGALGTLRIGYVTPGGDEIGMAVHGSGGWARWDVGESSLTVVSANPAWHTAPRRRFEVPVAEIGGYGAEGMAHLRAFFAVIRGEGPPDPLLPRLDDARRLLEIVEAAHESARTGRVVRLPA